MSGIRKGHAYRSTQCGSNSSGFVSWSEEDRLRDRIDEQRNKSLENVVVYLIALPGW